MLVNVSAVAPEGNLPEPSIRLFSGRACSCSSVSILLGVSILVSCGFEGGAGPGVVAVGAYVKRLPVGEDLGGFVHVPKSLD